MSTIKIIWRYRLYQYSDGKVIEIECHLPAENGKLSPVILEHKHETFLLNEPLTEDWGEYCEELNTCFVKKEIRFPQSVTWETITEKEFPDIIWTYKNEIKAALKPGSQWSKGVNEFVTEIEI